MLIESYKRNSDILSIKKTLDPRVYRFKLTWHELRLAPPINLNELKNLPLPYKYRLSFMWQPFLHALLQSTEKHMAHPIALVPRQNFVLRPCASFRALCYLNNGRILSPQNLDRLNWRMDQLKVKLAHDASIPGEGILIVPLFTGA